MSNPQEQTVSIVAISEALVNGIRNYLGTRPYDEVSALQASLLQEAQHFTPQIMEQVAAGKAAQARLEELEKEVADLHELLKKRDEAIGTLQGSIDFRDDMIFKAGITLTSGDIPPTG